MAVSGCDNGCGFLSLLGCCCGSSLTNLSADGVVKAVFVPLVDKEDKELVTLFDALNAKGFVEELSGVLSKTNSFLQIPEPAREAFVGVTAVLLPI